MRKLYKFIAVGAVLLTSSTAFAEIDPADVVFDQANVTFSDWVQFAGATNSGTKFANWTSVPSGGRGSYAISVWCTTSLVQKDLWVSSPAFTLEEGKTYAMDMQYQTWSGFHIPNLEIYVSSTAVTDADSASAVEELTPIYSITDMEANKNEWLPLEVENIKGKGENHIIFHISGECSGRYSIYDLEVYATSPALPAPNAPASLTAAANSGGC